MSRQKCLLNCIPIEKAIFVIHLYFFYTPIIIFNFSKDAKRSPVQICADYKRLNYLFPGKTDTPPVECSSRNSYIEPNVQNADADSITSDYNREKPNSTIDLKVEIHRKNSSESSEDATASEELTKPTVESIKNMLATDMAQDMAQERARLRTKINGNTFIHVLLVFLLLL